MAYLASNATMRTHLLMVTCFGTMLCVVSAKSADRLLPEHLQGTIRELVAPPDEIVPTTLNEIARTADIIVEGTLTRTQSYIPPSSDRVLTDYRISDAVVLSDRRSTMSNPTTLTVAGGEVMVNGLLTRMHVNFAPIRNQSRHLLFLRQSRSNRSGEYEVYKGAIFEIDGDTVRPLFKGAPQAFTSGVPSTLAALRSLVRAAAERR